MLGDIRQKSSQAILLAFRIGKIIHELPRAYGSNAIEIFAKECGFSVGTARDYHYLYRGIASEENLRLWKNPNRKYFQAIGQYIDGFLSDAPKTDAFRNFAHHILLYYNLVASEDDDGYEPDIGQVRQVSLYLKANRKRISQNLQYERAYRMAYVLRHPGGLEVDIPTPPEAAKYDRHRRDIANFEPVIKRFYFHLAQLVGVELTPKDEESRIDYEATKGIFLAKDKGQVLASSVNPSEKLYMNVEGEENRSTPAGKMQSRDKVILGDCLKVLKDERLFPHRSVAVVLTDPPYGEDYQGSIGYRPGRKVEFKNTRTTAEAAKLCGRVASLLRDREIIQEKFIWLSFFPIDYIHLLVPAVLDAFKGLEVIHQVLVWDKDGGGARLEPTRFFRRDAEAILYVNVGKKALNPELDGKSHRLHSSILKYKSRDEEKEEFQFWKSPKMLNHLIQVATFGKSTQLVLDPFAGRGSTGVAAIGLGRDFRLIEADEGQCRIARAAVTKASRTSSEQGG